MVTPCYPFKTRFVVIRRKSHVWIGVSVKASGDELVSCSDDGSSEFGQLYAAIAASSS